MIHKVGILKLIMNIKQWGLFKADDLNMALLGKYNRDAVLIMDKVGWD